MSHPAVFTASSSLVIGDEAVTATAAGAHIAIATKPASETGATPVELLVAAVASCMALSIRGAASLAGLTDRVRRVDVAAEGRKAGNLPSRLETIVATATIEGDLDAGQKQALLKKAETLCTVSNSLLSDSLTVHAELAS